MAAGTITNPSGLLQRGSTAGVETRLYQGRFIYSIPGSVTSRIPVATRMINIVSRMPYITDITMPQMSIDLAFLGSLPLLTAQAIMPPIQFQPPNNTGRITSNYHAPLTVCTTVATGTIVGTSDLAMKSLFAHGGQ
jgi:hypothetical protein